MSWDPKRTRACFYHVIRSHLLFILHFGVSLKMWVSITFRMRAHGMMQIFDFKLFSIILNFYTWGLIVVECFSLVIFFFVCPPKWELFRSPIDITKLILMETKERFCKKQNEKKNQNIKTFSVKTWSRDPRHLFSKNSNPLVMNGVD